MKTAAIYTRKSVYSSRGESIENQIKMCKKYLIQQNINEFLIYEDEGFSGKNFNRPNFKKMLKDAKEKKFNILICYRLDRVSRNIAGFSSLIEDLDRNDISFISVSEQFDTSKPMGRAMMYIASVFAQLERETIAERVRDNMLELARSGRWLGGRTPTGFKSTSLTVFDEYLNERKIFKLSPLEYELDIVKLIFDIYLDKKSLSKVSQYLKAKGIKTKMDNDFSKCTLMGILTNIVYVKADVAIFNFLHESNIETIGNPDGIHGMLSYNKRNGKNGPYRKTNDWICAVAKHEGIISSETWINVQNLLKCNRK